jgi:DDE family transposase
MAHRLKTPEGRELYALRKQTPEPVFGIVKSVLGIRRFSLRGLDKMRGEWISVTMAWNLARRGPRAPQASRIGLEGATKTLPGRPSERGRGQQKPKPHRISEKYAAKSRRVETQSDRMPEPQYRLEDKRARPFILGAKVSPRGCSRLL